MKKITKLTLTKETVRNLTVPHLSGIAAGTGTSYWCSYTCASGCELCTN